MKILMSMLDTERFNMPVAKVSDFTIDDLLEINIFCETNDVKLLIGRVPTNEISIAQAAGACGYELMDTLVYYRFNYQKKAQPELAAGIRINNVIGNSAYTDAITKIARQSFKGYFGHYHADNRLSQSLCDEIYVDWAYRSCLQAGMADAVLTASMDEKIAGFVTVKIQADGVGELILSGVLPSLQKHGLYQGLITAGMDWLHSQGLNQVITSTQINNVAVQKVWARLGFEMDHSYYTFHRWFS